MPLYRGLPPQLPNGASAADVASAHRADIAIPERLGVIYRNYWVDDGGQGVLFDRAPSIEAAFSVHREAHGLIADEIFDGASGVIVKRPA